LENSLPQDLVVVEVNGENRIDSRVLATQLNYEHKIVLQSIRRHKDRLEAKSVLLQNEAKPVKGSSGGRPETFYMLDERQSLILAGSLKKGVEADEWHDRLVDAFIAARNRIKELEDQIITQGIQLDFWTLAQNPQLRRQKIETNEDVMLSLRKETECLKYIESVYNPELSRRRGRRNTPRVVTTECQVQARQLMLLFGQDIA
jgi:hypothetical protein